MDTTVCYCVVGGVQAERHNSQCVFFPSMLISPCRTDIPAWCVRCFHVVSVTVPRFSHTQEDFNHIPLSCCLTRWTSIIVANFPPRLWTPLPTHTHTCPSIHPSGVTETQNRTNAGILSGADDFILDNGCSSY